MTTARTIHISCVFFLASSLFAAPAPEAGQTAPSRIPVVATFSILADFARNVGGERIDVRALVGPNGDAHVYQPTPGDARLLNAAQLIVVNGLGLEGWIDRLIAASGAKAPIVLATKGVVPRNMEEDGRIGKDPHAWQSVANARTYVVNIAQGLVSADPAGAAAYRANAGAYLAKLDVLEAEIRAEIARIPPERRRIITTHDAFGYFGEAYSFTFIAPAGVSTESEASAKDIAKIIRQIKAEHVPAVFLENITDPRTSRRIAEESGAKIGGELYSDALSPADGPAPDYIAMMRRNVNELTAALEK